MQNSIKFDDCFGDQDTFGYTETKFIFIKQLATLHLQVVMTVYRRVQTCYRQKPPKLTLKTSFSLFVPNPCAQTILLCLQMRSADYCGHFDVFIVAITQHKN